MMSTPITDLTCTACVYYVEGHCEWARSYFCPPWIQEFKPVAPEMGAVLGYLLY